MKIFRATLLLILPTFLGIFICFFKCIVVENEASGKVLKAKCNARKPNAMQSIKLKTMEDTDDDAHYPYAVPYHQSSYNASNNPFHRPKLPLRPPHDTAPVFTDDDDEEQDDNDYGDDGDDDESENHFPQPQQPKELDGKQGFDRFGVRNPPPIFFPKPEYQPKSSRDDWSETATFLLLETWGEKFLQLGKKSLKFEQWVEIAKKVSAASKTLKTDAQCRNRLDTLKKKYKREKQKQKQATAASASGGFISKWVYFRHMDVLLSSSAWQTGLPCGVDAGEFVFLNPRVYLNQSTCDEVQDSPEDDDDEDDKDDDEEEEGDRRMKRQKDADEDEDSFRVLADSIRRFGDIYERIENNKKQQMLDLEKMRMEIDRDLEMQKSQILEQTKVALAKIREGNDDIDASVSNMSG